MNVLSLFDGMSGGQLAIQRAGIKVNNYYASEVEEQPIKVTQHNFPNTIQVGSVIDLKKKQLKEMNIDILIGGSPCQGFSVAGKMKGMTTSCNMEITTLKQYKKLKREGFKFDGQSYLFWEYMRILKIIKPKYFLLENVRIAPKWKKVFDEVVGIDPIFINSNLLSAQNRQRYYWCNWDVETPEDAHLMLKDVLDDDNFIALNDKAYAVTKSNHAGNIRDYFLKKQSNIVLRKEVDGKYEVKDGFITFTLPRSKYPGKVHKVKCDVGDGRYDFRPLSINERERLQTVPVGYTKCVTKTHAGDMLGNGFTIDVISHILKGIKS